MGIDLLSSVEIGIYFWLILVGLLSGATFALGSYNWQTVESLFSSRSGQEKPIGTPLSGNNTIGDNNLQPPRLWKGLRYVGLALIVIAWIATIVLYAI